jgi:hypothetical protein
MLDTSELFLDAPFVEKGQRSVRVPVVSDRA